MGTRLAHQIARSVDAPAVLWPVLPDLFRGIPSLGSTPRLVIRMLRKAGLRQRHHVIDLACGKGSAAVALAFTVGCRVVGVDGCAAFLAEAAASARRRGVTRLCTWIEADIHRLPARIARRRFDAALMLGLDPLPEAARCLRALTVRGGVYVLDDCVLDTRRGRVPPEWADTPTVEQFRLHIEQLGDRVEGLLVPAPSETRRLNDRLYARLSRNAAVVGRLRPGLMRALREFLRRQRSANTLLTGPLRPSLWVVRRR